MRILIVGCGYVGMEVARALVRMGHDVHGVRRSPEGLRALASENIHPLAGDVSDPASVAAWPRNWDLVVNAASSSGGGVDAYRRVYLDGTRNLASHLEGAGLGRFVHVGSTSVYGQADGSWVDEASPAQPGSDSARVLVEAEHVLLVAAQSSSFPAVLLRVSGIYGPGRGHARQQLLRGEARLDGDGSRWLNMIHRDDVAAAVLAAATSGQPGRVYNVTDDEPVRQRDFLEWLAALHGLPMPGPGHGGEGRSTTRARTDKRVSNRRLREELGWRPTFPTYRQGYAQPQR